MIEKETGLKKTQPHKKSRKRKLIACAALATVGAGTVGAAFAISAAHDNAHKKVWHHQSVPYYSFGPGFQEYKMVSDRRIREQAWGAVQQEIPGDIGSMDAHPPKIGEPMVFLDDTQVDVKKWGVRHENKYAVTVQCDDSMGLECHVVKAEKIEAKDYRRLEDAAQEAANIKAPGHNVVLRITDPANMAAIFEDVSAFTPKPIVVKCRNPLKYSCTAS